LLQVWRAKFAILRKDSLNFHKTYGRESSYKIVLKDIIGVSRVETSGIVFEIKRRADGTSTSPGDEESNIVTLQIKVKSDADLYNWIGSICAYCPGIGGISNPTDFKHAVHVGFDLKTGAFVGLPAEWLQISGFSAITKEDYERNPKAVRQVVEFYTTYNGFTRKEVGGFPSKGSTGRYKPLRVPPTIPRITQQPEPKPAIQQGSSANSKRTERLGNSGSRNGLNNPSHSFQACSDRANTPIQCQVNIAIKEATSASPVTNGIQHIAAVKSAKAASISPKLQRDGRIPKGLMARLKDVVSNDNPRKSYSKQKEIGRGASGLVYVAKVVENPLSPIARQVLAQGSDAKVAIKQMNLARQPRKELIIDEIIVMRESRHQNIVNFLEAFLLNNFTKLWVVMEYIKGSALTDVIQNNWIITENQISTICLQVSFIIWYELLQTKSPINLPRLRVSTRTQYYTP
jgi:serine/threonine-protein kinase CLA4